MSAVALRPQRALGPCAVHSSRSLLTILRSFSAVTSRCGQGTGGQRPRRNPSSFLELLLPETHVAEALYPKISIFSSAPRSPDDLSALRPPALEYVPPPSPEEDGRISLREKFTHWNRKRLATYHFYLEGYRRYCSMLSERTTVARAMGQVVVRNPSLAALYGGTYLRASPSSPLPEQPMPSLTRRQFQMLLRTGDVKGDALVLPNAILGLILLLFRGMTPVIWPLLRLRAPPTCQLPEDRNKDVQGLCDRFNYVWEHVFPRKHERNPDGTYRLQGTELDKAQNLLELEKMGAWGHVTTGTPLIDPKTREWDFFKDLGLIHLPHYQATVADTALIMRKGGFARLSADDIYDYCVQCASPTFIRFAKESLKQGDFQMTEAMKKSLVPVLEGHARVMLQADWTRIRPLSVGYLDSYNRLFNRYSPDTVTAAVNPPKRINPIPMEQKG